MYNVISIINTNIINTDVCYIWTSLVAQTVKNPPAMQETWVQYLGREDPLENGVATHFGILTGKPHGEWSLVGCSPWGRKES